jgi:hypothetical protein
MSGHRSRLLGWCFCNLQQKIGGGGDQLPQQFTHLRPDGNNIEMDAANFLLHLIDGKSRLVWFTFRISTLKAHFLFHVIIFRHPTKSQCRVLLSALLVVVCLQHISAYLLDFRMRSRIDYQQFTAIVTEGWKYIGVIKRILSWASSTEFSSSVYFCKPILVSSSHLRTHFTYHQHHHHRFKDYGNRLFRPLILLRLFPPCSRSVSFTRRTVCTVWSGMWVCPSLWKCIFYCSLHYVMINISNAFRMSSFLNWSALAQSLTVLGYLLSAASILFLSPLFSVQCFSVV